MIFGVSIDKIETPSTTSHSGARFCRLDRHGVASKPGPTVPGNRYDEKVVREGGVHACVSVLRNVGKVQKLCFVVSFVVGEVQVDLEHRRG